MTIGRSASGAYNKDQIPWNKSEPISESVKSQILELYRVGGSLYAIAKTLHVSMPAAVYHTVKEAGIMRPVGGKIGWKRKPFTKEHLQNLRDSHLGQEPWNLGISHSEETKRLLGGIAWKSYQGGTAGATFASFLCPVGFIREHRVFWAIELNLHVTKRQHKFFSLDFAHVKGRIDIEFDGPGHKATPQEDWQRDEMMRYLGWKIIRIKHDKNGW